MKTVSQLFLLALVLSLCAQALGQAQADKWTGTAGKSRRNRQLVRHHGRGGTDRWAECEALRDGVARQSEHSGRSRASGFNDQLCPADVPPIITIHGDQDDVVPYTQAVRLHAALDKAGVPNQLVTIHGRKHDGFNRQDLVSSYATIREFLRKNNILKAPRPIQP